MPLAGNKSLCYGFFLRDPMPAVCACVYVCVCVCMCACVRVCVGGGGGACVKVYTLFMYNVNSQLVRYVYM